VRAAALALIALLAGCAERPPAAAAPARAALPAARYLALGDSFTIGTGSSPAESFPSRLVERWSSRCALTHRNLGVNGYTTQDLLDRELPEVPGFAPTFVTLAVGANDLVRGRTVGEYRAQLARIFDALSAAGVAPARVVTLPQPAWDLSPTGASFGDPAETGRAIAAFNDALRAVSAERGARYVDLTALFRAQAAQGLVAPDGLHPSAAAHEAWAAALDAALPPCGV
jgi:lysophospholipase L1-like esterase